jgi:hypothetical protein
MVPAQSIFYISLASSHIYENTHLTHFVAPGTSSSSNSSKHSLRASCKNLAFESLMTVTKRASFSASLQRSSLDFALVIGVVFGSLNKSYALAHVLAVKSSNSLSPGTIGSCGGDATGFCGSDLRWFRCSLLPQLRFFWKVSQEGVRSIADCPRTLATNALCFQVCISFRFAAMDTVFCLFSGAFVSFSFVSTTSRVRGMNF